MRYKQAGKTDLLALNARLLNNCRRDDFAGYDPFDSLNSTLLKSTPLYQNEFVRLAWLQLGKRSPLNLRPLLRVPRMRNPKGVGLFIAGLLQDYRRNGEQQYLDQALGLADWLIDQRCDRTVWQHSCWGYHFDWQARAFYVPVGKPNIITTCYVARALFELGEVIGNKHYQDMALDAARFIHLYLYTEADGRSFYAYIPGETTLVHNASLWGAAWCVVAAAHTGDNEMLEQALQVARESVRDQAEDGSWVYGTRHHHQFIDGFHTGYNLEALDMIRAAIHTNEFDDCIDKGYRYYVLNFFSDDGTAKYYHNATFPVDMHNFAQAIFTLIKIGGSEEDLVLCQKVIQRALERLYLPDKGYFAYQKTRWMTNRINYSRWTQAWSYYSLAFYNRYSAGQDHAEN